MKLPWIKKTCLNWTCLNRKTTVLANVASNKTSQNKTLCERLLEGTQGTTYNLWDCPHIRPDIDYWERWPTNVRTNEHKDGMAAGRQLETPASAHQRALWAAVAGSSRQQNSVLSHLLEQFSSSQQTTDGRRQRTGDLGTASKKKAKKTVPEQSVHSRLLEHTHQAALIHAVAVVGVSQDFLHFPPASPAFCFIRWGSYCVTVEAAALFSDQTIILLMPAVLIYVKIK